MTLTQLLAQKRRMKTKTRRTKSKRKNLINHTTAILVTFISIPINRILKLFVIYWNSGNISLTNFKHSSLSRDPLPSVSYFLKYSSTLESGIPAPIAATNALASFKSKMRLYFWNHQVKWCQIILGLGLPIVPLPSASYLANSWLNFSDMTIFRLFAF